MNTISAIGEMITQHVTWNSLIVGSSLFLLFFLLYMYAIQREKKKLNSMVSDKISVMQKAFDVCKDAVLILSEKQEILYANKPMRKLLKLNEHYTTRRKDLVLLRV